MYPVGPALGPYLGLGLGVYKYTLYRTYSIKSNQPSDLSMPRPKRRSQLRIGRSVAKRRSLTMAGLTMSTDASRIAKSNVSRSKAHERNVANWLTEWSGVQFRRRRVTGRDEATRMVELTGDVIPIQGDFLFNVEAKCERKFSFDGLFARPTVNLFTGWWHQTCYDAQLATKSMGRHFYPMLFFKPIVQQNWVAFSRKSVPALKLDLTTFPHLVFNWYETAGPIDGDVSHTKNKKMVAIELDPVVFCRWEEFCQWVDPTRAWSNGKLLSNGKSSGNGHATNGHANGN